MNPWPFVALIILLLAGSEVVTFKAWTGARDGRAKAEQQLEQVTAQAKQCSDGVLALEKAGRERNAAGKQAQAQATVRAAPHERKAVAILSSPPAVPGDSCGSADAAINDWIGGKK